MKTKIAPLLTLGLFGLITVPLVQLNGSSSAPPNGRSGSIGDNGSSCTGCHNTFAAENITNVISTNVPQSGYIPGETYSVTVDGIADPSSSKYGMQVTAEDASGNAVGVFTAGTGTSVSGQYVGHSPAFSGSNPSWTFTWQAPSTNEGNITFYGAFVIANSAQGSLGDRVKLSTTTISPNPSVGIKKLNNNLKVVLAGNNLTVTSEGILSNPTVQIFTLNGKVIVNKGVINDSSKMFNVSLPFELSSGVYLVKVSDGRKSYSTQIVK